MLRYLPCFALLMIASRGLAADAADVDPRMQAIRSVAARGAGHPEAIAAVQQLSQAGPESLLPILAAMDDANPLAANWLRGAFEAIAERTRRDDGRLPVDGLECTSSTCTPRSCSRWASTRTG
jgi:hypothetical protein